MALKNVGSPASAASDSAKFGDISTAIAAIGSGPMNQVTNAGSGTSIGTTEASLGTVSITPSATSSVILLLAVAVLTKDTGATARTATIRCRRGAAVSGTLVGVAASVTSPATASAAYYGIASVLGVDSPATTSAVTYTLSAAVGAGASTAVWNIVAIELKGVKGDTGPAGDTLSVVNAQTGNYTLVLSDVSKAVEVTSVSAATVTIPPNSSVAFPVGTIIEVAQLGAGQVTVAPGSGVTLQAAGTLLKTRVQYSSLSLRKRATDTWLVVGDAA